ncbi:MULTISPECIES: hypothetical protein [unclassified Pseudomonas]|uniref:hypothetical protein n=1 Tax=unclassified Pseudomonas TaxID=196821 RepID=UPI001E2E6767|nr:MULTISPECIES: hypothetical protein [unclassified Pseudomonas]MCE0912969.1 hypothetical protein [Pseudomonas sp. NMI760_13]MCF1486213.1 hypothetical protein [Pseudomonas sp. AA27]MCP8633968.1 hypothetical protein [Pseudomonas sp. DVZ6]MDD7783908.1 hypothetical protein [Pseudomonas sp. DVZ24]
MTIYFHAATGGFYDTRVHGERTMLIPDPDWKPAMIEVPDPKWIQPEGTVGKTKAPTVRERDPKSAHPNVQVKNPLCCLPPAAELMEITLNEYQALFRAQSAGKVIATMDGRPTAIEPPPLTWEQRKNGYLAAVQQFMDKAAQTAGYSDIKDAISYAEEAAVPKFQAEALAFRAWRSLSWAYCYEQLEVIEHGRREAPTSVEFVTELPELVLSNV